MSSGTIITIVVVVMLIILAYVLGILIRKRNASLLEKLETKKEEIFNLPVNDEIEEVKNLHLIGQSQVAFREWNQKWVDLSLNSFADIENQLFDAEGLNNAFRFISTKNAIANIESQINLIDEDVTHIREALSELRAQEEKNSGRVRHALDLFETLQATLANNESVYGETLPELQAQFKNIETEFSEFVTLNTSGDPLEAAQILDRTEDHMIALNQIMERLPDLVEKVDRTLPAYFDDLQDGYEKLIADHYVFAENDIEARFQAIESQITENKSRLLAFDLDSVEEENAEIQSRIDDLYTLFTKEIEANTAVKKAVKHLPEFITHLAENQDKLDAEIKRLEVKYQLSESKRHQIEAIQTEFTALSEATNKVLETLSSPFLPYSQLLEQFQTTWSRLNDMEEDQIAFADYLNSLETDEQKARTKAATYINKLHTIKRYMEKRNLPGIPQTFLSEFFETSYKVEEFSDSLLPTRLDMEVVNRHLDIATTGMADLEDATYLVVQQASLTEQLLQYANRYRASNEGIQTAFTRALDIFENDYDYRASFEEISYALETVEPGVTARFVNSYEKTRQLIRF